MCDLIPEVDTKIQDETGIITSRDKSNNNHELREENIYTQSNSNFTEFNNVKSNTSKNKIQKLKPLLRSNNLSPGSKNMTSKPPNYKKPKLLKRRPNLLLANRPLKALNVDYNLLYSKFGSHLMVRNEIERLKQLDEQNFNLKTRMNIREELDKKEYLEHQKRIGLSGFQSMNSVINRTPERDSKVSFKLYFHFEPYISYIYIYIYI